MENFIETFKRTVAQWESYIERNELIQKLIDSNNLMFFFIKNGNLYGSNEDGRISFATMNDKKESKVIKNEIMVHAYDLEKSTSEDKHEVVLNRKAMKGIKILDRDEAENFLHKKKKKK